MNASIAVAVCTAFLLAAGAPLAQTNKAQASNSHSSMSMGGHMGDMDEHMKKMQALHEKLMIAATPDERQKAMDEQRTEMHAGMGMMNQMHDGGMMGGMGGGAMAQKGKPLDAAAQMQAMQKRMDMMQMMMQTMMDQQGMMGPSKVGK